MAVQTNHPLYRTVMVITGDITGGLCGMCDQSPSTSAACASPAGQRHRGLGLAATEMHMLGVGGDWPLELLVESLASMTR